MVKFSILQFGDAYPSRPPAALLGGCVFKLSQRVLPLTLLVSILLGPMGCNRRHTGAWRVPPAPTFFDTSTISVDSFMDDPNVRQHVLAMPFGEVAERLHSLHFEGRSTFSFHNKSGPSYEQTDQASIHQDDNGHRHTVSISPTGQMELIAMGDKVYVRFNKGQSRQKSRRDVETEDLPEKLFAGLNQSLSLFRHVAFTDPTADTFEGREIIRYRLTLDNTPLPQTSVGLLTSQARLPAAPPGKWREASQPTTLSGSLSIDKQTGVVLKAQLYGQLNIVDPHLPNTTLSIRYNHTLTQIGSAGNVRAPERSIAEYRRPIRNRKPLAFFESPTGKHTAGSVNNDASDQDEDTDPERPDAPPPDAQE